MTRKRQPTDHQSTGAEPQRGSATKGASLPLNPRGEKK